MTPRCHADGSSPASPHGPYGVLCSSCWERVSVIVERLTGKRPRCGW